MCVNAHKVNCFYALTAPYFYATVRLMNVDALQIAEIESLAKSNGWSVAALCRAAEINQSSFGRWKRGETDMKLKNYRRLVDVASRPRRDV